MKNFTEGIEAPISAQQLLVDFLKPYLDGAVREALKSIEFSVTADRDILNVDQAAAMLSVSKHHLYTLCSAKKIPYFKKGKRNYFSHRELETWIRGGE